MPNVGGNSEQVALFRYSLIVPALNGTFSEKSITDYFNNLATKEQTLPTGKKKYFNASSYRNWFYQYRKFGFAGLKPGQRSDYGFSKNIPSDVMDTVREIKRNKKNITKRGIYAELCSMGVIRKVDVAESTFYRFLRLNKYEELSNNENTLECKAYEAASCNDIWQADTSQVMRIKLNGKSEPVYLVHIIDDASRLVVGQVLTLNDNAVVFQDTLKKAIKIYGVPKVLYVDNGSPYSNEQLSLICANIGIHLIHAKPYFPRRQAGK